MAEKDTGYHFGRNLRRFRLSAGISQSRLATLATETGLGRWSQGDVSSYESSAVCANGRFADAAARVLKIDVFCLFVPEDGRRLSAGIRRVRRILARPQEVAAGV